MDDFGRDDPQQPTRRTFLKSGPLVAGALAAGLSGCSVPVGCRERQRDDARRATENPSSSDSEVTSNPDVSDWSGVRARFDADPDLVHMAGMLLSTHPRSVREAIAEHRRGLDDNPTEYLYRHMGRSAIEHNRDGEQWAMESAGRYLGIEPANVALTDSTTEGLAVVYNGLNIREDQEILLGYWNHWATRGSVIYASRNRGFDTRSVDLDTPVGQADPERLVDRLIDAIDDHTRAVATTWVHSVSGLKLPIAEIGRRIDDINRHRSEADRVLFCVDGVHGFGVEDFGFDELNCDFFVAGCHKWLFGPRGTGIVAAGSDAWQQATPTVPTFSTELTPGRRFTPGGFKPYEHVWALHEAFDFHLKIGKDRIEARIHELADRLVDELANMDHVRLRTPGEPELRAGIVTFVVDGIGPYAVVDHLRDHGVVASVTPGSNPIARLAPGLLNDHDGVGTTLEAIDALG